MFLTSTLEVFGQLHTPPTVTPFPPSRERAANPQSQFACFREEKTLLTL